MRSSLLLLLAPSTALAANCPFTTSVVDANGLLAQAEDAYAELDVDGFDAALDELSLSLQCLDERMPTPTAARVHRMQALRSFIAGDDAKWVESLRAAKVLQPDYAFPDTLLPPNHPLITEYARMSAASAPGTPVPPSSEGNLAFDGVQVDERPSHATFFQVLGPDGVVLNRYVWPNQPLPAYAGEDGAIAGEPDDIPPPDEPTAPTEPERGDRPLPILESTGIAVAGVGAVGASVFYFRALHHKSQAAEPQTQPQFRIDEAAYKQARNRTITMGAITAGGVLLTAVGLALPISDTARLRVQPGGLTLTVGVR